MGRPILIGILMCGLAASSAGFAGAEEIVAAASTSTVASPATRVAEPNLQRDDAAAPTAGADMAMWNVAPSAASFEAPGSAARHTSRLRRFASGIVSRSSAIASSLTRSALRFIGTPYVFGGTRTTGFDCSGYVQHVFAMLGFRLPRTADAQYDAGHRIADLMEPGDLVFFHTYAPGVSHVGIYLGNNKFISSSSSHGVSIASLHDSYWAPRYLGAKRVFGY